MSVTYLVVGGVLEDRARVKAVITGSSARLAVDTDPALASPTFYGPVSASTQSVVSLEATGLTADTQYYYAIEDGGVLDTVTTGKFRTHPPVGVAASFTFAVASCGQGVNYPGDEPDLLSTTDVRVSNHPVFDTIRTSDPLFFVHQGDLHYYNIGQFITPASIENYRAAIDDVFKQSRQHQLYREVPLIYTWDDHDFGPGNSNGAHEGKSNVAQVYRERFPSYDLAETSGAVYHAWQVARVLFVTLDTRFWRSDQNAPDNADKTMLGVVQKAWLDDVLRTNPGGAAFLVMLSPTPWMQFSNDTWEGYQTEQDELIAMFTATGWRDRMVMINGDTHALALDTGGGNVIHTGNVNSSFPVGVFGSIDSILEDGTPNSQSQYDTGPTQIYSGQWGDVHIDDGGDVITVTMTGHDGAAGETIWRTHTFHVTGTDSLPRARDWTATYDPGLSRVRLRSGELIPYADVADTFDRAVVDGWGASERGNLWTVEGDPDPPPTPDPTGTSSASTGFGTTLTVPLPASSQPGELAVVAFNVNDNFVAVTSTPADQGWTALVGSPVATSSMIHGIWYRVLQVGDPDPNITIGADKKISGAVMTVSGQDGATPIAVEGVPEIRSVSTVDTVAPGITTTHGAQMILGYFAEESSSATTVAVPGMTEQVSQFETGGGQVSVALFTETVPSASATGDRTATYDVASAAGFGVLIAITSAPASSTPAEDFDVNEGTAKVAVDAIEVRRYATTGSFDDVEFTLDVKTPVVTGSGALSAAAVARFTDSDNFYMVNAFFQPDNTISFIAFKRTAGTFTTLDTASVIPYVGDTWHTIRMQCTGTLIRGRIWQRGSTEPTAWHLEATDVDHTLGAIGTHSNRNTGNENPTPILIEYDNVLRVSPPPVTIDVDRSLDGVRWTPVRGGTDRIVWPGDVFRLDDYEFPAGRELTYRMTVTDENTLLLQTETATVTATLDTVWLKSIARPFTNRTVKVVEYSEVERTARNGVHQVVNRSTPIVVTDIRSSRQWTLTVVVPDLAAADEMDTILLAGGAVYVQVPSWYPQIPTMYAIVGDVTMSRRALYGDRRYFELPLTEVSAPGGEVVGATINYAGINRLYDTYADLAAANATYADVSELIGIPADVRPT